LIDAARNGRVKITCAFVHALFAFAPLAMARKRITALSFRR
jgi:hypothetical protein